MNAAFAGSAFVSSGTAVAAVHGLAAKVAIRDTAQLRVVRAAKPKGLTLHATTARLASAHVGSSTLIELHSAGSMKFGGAED